MTDVDALVAEKVFGWQRSTFDGQRAESLWNDKALFDAMVLAGLTHLDDKGKASRVPPYSTDIAAAWEVVERLKAGQFMFWKMGALVTLGGPSDKEVWCEFSKGLGSEHYRGESATVPHAICIAALKAVGV